MAKKAARTTYRCSRSHNPAQSDRAATGVESVNPWMVSVHSSTSPIAKPTIIAAHAVPKPNERRLARVNSQPNGHSVYVRR